MAAAEDAILQLRHVCNGKPADGLVVESHYVDFHRLPQLGADGRLRLGVGVVETRKPHFLGDILPDRVT